jgi:hypothetical protein
MADSKKNVVMGSRREPDTKTNWSDARRWQNNLNVKQESVISESSRQNSRRQEETVPEGGESTVSQELLRLWRGDTSRAQEMERPPLETGTRGLVKDD